VYIPVLLVYEKPDRLAYHEMRLIFASMLLHFDLEMCDEAQGWLDPDVYNLWDKKSLHVKLTQVFLKVFLGFQTTVYSRQGLGSKASVDSNIPHSFTGRGGID
jgi:hypothetical protein